MAAKIKLTKEQQQMLIAGFVMLAGFGYTYIRFFWLPTSDRIKKATDEIEKVGKEIQTARANAARLPRIEAELLELSQKAIDAERRLPKTKAVPDILVTMTSLARKHDVEVMSFTPGGQAGREYFTELNYPMVAKGSFHSLGKFFAAIALEERIFNVVNIVFPGGDTGIMSVNFTLISYQYKG
jgi:type IV pilus assembly protein PilO